MIKQRRRKQKEFFEEVYTDKDRAAAVSFGFFDIKQSLTQKARQDRNEALSLPEEAEPGSLLAMGMREAKNGNFESAVQFISKAGSTWFIYFILPHLFYRKLLHNIQDKPPSLNSVY